MTAVVRVESRGLAGGSAEAGRPKRATTIRAWVVAAVAGLLVLGAAALVSGQPWLLAVAAGAGGVAFAIALLVKPDIATIVVLVLVYSNAPVVGAQLHGIPYALAAVVPALLLVPLAERVLLRREAVIVPPTMPFVLGFLLVEIVSTLASRDPAAAVGELVRVIGEGILLYLLIINTVRTPDVLRAAIMALVAVAAGLAVLTIAQQLGGLGGEDFLGFARVEGRGFDPGTGAAIQARAAGPIGEKNFYAQMLLAVVPLAIVVSRTETGLIRLGAVLAAVLIGIGIALTFSRGAAIGAVLLVPAMITLRVVGLRGMLGVAMAAIFVLAVVPNYTARLSSLEGIAGAVSASEDTDPVLAQRANDVLAAVLAFADHPIIGVGPGLFPTYYREYAYKVGGLVGDADYAAHSLYAEVASETGILGLVTFGGIIGTTLVALLAARARSRHDPNLVAIADGFVLVIVVYLTSGLFLHIAYQRYIWMFLALSAAAALVVWRGADVSTPVSPGSRRSMRADQPSPREGVRTRTPSSISSSAQQSISSQDSTAASAT